MPLALTVEKCIRSEVSKYVVVRDHVGLVCLLQFCACQSPYSCSGVVALKTGWERRVFKFFKFKFWLSFCKNVEEPDC